MSVRLSHSLGFFHQKVIYMPMLAYSLSYYAIWGESTVLRCASIYYIIIDVFHIRSMRSYLEYKLQTHRTNHTLGCIETLILPYKTDAGKFRECICFWEIFTFKSLLLIVLNAETCFLHILVFFSEIPKLGWLSIITRCTSLRQIVLSLTCTQGYTIFFLSLSCKSKFHYLQYRSSGR